ncbi:MAG: tetratricopeptide repeat protein [Archangiaceae bacterium]|nr:tetratricopeptide repeat protein [Archangiaceae bacterium]
MSRLRARPVVFAAALAFVSACATTPEKKPEGDPTAPPAETPEVPYEAKKSPAEPGPSPTQPRAEQPATGGQPPAAEPAPAPEPAPPPKPKFDAASSARFKEAAEALKQGNLDAAERGFRDVLDRNAQADHAWTNLGLIAERKGDLDGAERLTAKRWASTSCKTPRGIVWRASRAARAAARTSTPSSVLRSHRTPQPSGPESLSSTRSFSRASTSRLPPKRRRCSRPMNATCARCSCSPRST